MDGLPQAEEQHPQAQEGREQGCAGKKRSVKIQRGWQEGLRLGHIMKALHISKLVGFYPKVNGKPLKSLCWDEGGTGRRVGNIIIFGFSVMEKSRGWSLSWRQL